MYINWFAWIIFFMIVYVIQKIGGNNNSPNVLNVMTITITVIKTG